MEGHVSVDKERRAGERHGKLVVLGILATSFYFDSCACFEKMTVTLFPPLSLFP